MIRLLTKNETQIRAYHDTVIYYSKMGNDNSDNPFSILKSEYENPLAITTDNSTLKIYVNPGMLICYGRQIEITEKIEVYDFLKSETTQGKKYVTIYLEINLEDVVNETVAFRVHVNTLAYENIKNVYRDNLYRASHGIYLIPIGHLTFTPSSANPFADIGLYIQEAEINTKKDTELIDDNTMLNGKRLGDLCNGSKFNNARKADRATECEKIGGVTISSTNLNLITSNVFNVYPFRLDTFNKGSKTSGYSNLNLDLDHASELRFWIRGANAKVELNYYEKNDLITFGQWLRFDLFDNHDYLSRPGIEVNIPISSISKSRFVLTLMGYYNYETFGNYGEQPDFRLKLELGEKSAPSTWPYLFWTGGTGSNPTEENCHASFPLCKFIFTKGSYGYNVECQGMIGGGTEYSNGLLHWRYDNVSFTLTNSAYLVLDVIYKGEVNLL